MDHSGTKDIRKIASGCRKSDIPSGPAVASPERSSGLQALERHYSTVIYASLRKRWFPDISVIVLHRKVE